MGVCYRPGDMGIVAGLSCTVLWVPVWVPVLVPAINPIVSRDEKKDICLLFFC